jgi:surface polysaccharide O-acyltransferase-like enzyme
MTVLSGGRTAVSAPPPSRCPSADLLKVVLVTGVIAGHVTMSWADIDAWVFDEPPVREPLLSTLKVLAVIGVMFAMALFFMIAGVFTPGALVRKGTRRFLADRSVRLGLPLVFYVLFLAPVVAYHDEQDWAGWDRGFPAFTWHMWTHPELGAAWFLLVLLVFSALYAVLRSLRPRVERPPSPTPAPVIVVAVLLVAATSYAIRIVAPFGEERLQLVLGQGPSWVTGFVLGVAGAERGWFDHLPADLSRVLLRVASVSALGVVGVFGLASTGGDTAIDRLGGKGTWQSFVLLVFEAPFVVATSLWLYDVSRRRVRRLGPMLKRLSRAAFAAYLVHEVVAVYAVVATQHVQLPREVEWLAAVSLAVVGSFVLAGLLVRLPGVRRVV